ncbi:AAA family ATPase [Clostridium perfringens]|uniref:RecD-like DNA helicase YrrC n=1 Tax=Clostridium perfringens TaxID=1502 RepID=A0A140GS08_CLOPF|nr:AAA family ATPase [Clostridium perfringens]AMN31317.1 RecD-like DNA helicase YrrC [Clostridium perfringens]
MNTAVKNNLIKGLVKADDFWSMKKDEQVTAKLVVKEEYIFKEDSSWGVYYCDNAYSNGEALYDYSIKIAGVVGERLVIGNTYKVIGKVEEFNGIQSIKIQNINRTNPINKIGVINHLKTFGGLGDVLSERIFDKYGLNSMEAIINNPQEVANSIKGLSPEKAIDIATSIKDDIIKQEILVQLLSYEISVKDANALYRKFGVKSVDIIKENPYLLIETSGFSFEKADKIAISLGGDIKSKHRIKAGIIDMLIKIAGCGHCYFEEDLFIQKATNYLSYKLDGKEMFKLLKNEQSNKCCTYDLGGKTYQIIYSKLADCYKAYNSEKNAIKKEYLKYKLVELNPREIVECINILEDEKKILSNEGRIYLQSIWNAEQVIAKKLFELECSKQPMFYDIENSKNIVKQELDNILAEKNVKLEDRQYEACLNFNLYTGGVNVLIGSAGRGKTFTLKILLELNKRLNEKRFQRPLVYNLFAPTGRASKVMQKAMDERDAKTIHRGLNGTLGNFEFNEENPLTQDVLILDETSMVDVFLLRDLLKAMTLGQKIILVGDIQQLQSVGPGSILKDIIESKSFNVCELLIPKRQKEFSEININAERVLSHMPVQDGQKGEFHFKTCHEEEKMLNNLVESYTRLISKVDINEIQILSPQKKGLLGVNFLNYYIQSKVNPKDTGLKIKKEKFTIRMNNVDQEIQQYIKVGDRAMNKKNVYDLKWYKKDRFGSYEELNIFGITNGEIGTVVEIKEVVTESGSKQKRVIVEFEEGFVFFDGDLIDNLELAYAVTIHKSQGSQWKYVLFPISSSHRGMWDIHILYTAITRAKDVVYITGNHSVMEASVKISKRRVRRTSLKKKIVDEFLGSI